jgi:hypothetical protein
MATTPANSNSLISALRANTGPLTNNPGVRSWEFDYNGAPLTFKNRTPGGANNPAILKMPNGLPVTPKTPVAPDPIEQPIQVEVPVVDIPAPPLDPDSDPDPDPVTDPEPDPVVEVIPVGDPSPIIVTDLPPAEEPPKTGTVTIEDFTRVDPPVPPTERDLDYVPDERDLDFVPDERDFDYVPKVGTVTIEDFTRENEPVIPGNDAPTIRDILNEQIDAPVGTVTIEPVSDNVDVTMIDPADNDPFGFDVYEGPAGDDVVPAIPTDDELEELMLMMAGF